MARQPGLDKHAAIHPPGYPTPPQSAAEWLHAVMGGERLAQLRRAGIGIESQRVGPDPVAGS
jgi:hypothetical protein